VKKKVKKQSRPRQEEPKPASDGVTESEKQFDFGGLPKRDLKRNLGCG
jgi:hypothetical protein